MCHEPCGDIKEDCLYLNVFTPKDTLDSGRKTGVAIWFHGGFRDSDMNSIVGKIVKNIGLT